MGNTNENYNYKIYAHVNKVNGKIYIGQTKQKVEDRWRDGLGYKPYGKKSPSHFWNAIQKYEWNNFEHIILKGDLTLKEANYWEEYYIKQYNSTNKQYGYNISFGGDNRKLSEETKKKISMVNKGHLVSEETRQKISNANKGKVSFRKGT